MNIVICGTMHDLSLMEMIKNHFEEHAQLVIIPDNTLEIRAAQIRHHEAITTWADLVIVIPKDSGEIDESTSYETVIAACNSVPVLIWSREYNFKIFPNEETKEEYQDLKMADVYLNINSGKLYKITDYNVRECKSYLAANESGDEDFGWVTNEKLHTDFR